MAMSEKQYYIALNILMRNSLSRALQLLEQYGSAKEVWEHLDEPAMDECWKRAQKEMDWIMEHQIQVYTLSDSNYPYRLRQCPDKPLVLYGKGNINLADGYVVSIVGTRRPTQRGIEQTEMLVRGLGEKLNKVTIISGGAYGIDIAAHRAAIKYNIPTIIVPAHGLDRIYPAMHRKEAIESLENGGIITEFISGTEPLAPYFIQRNRIVAGLADAVVVVETKSKGGSRITARMAQDYNRDLFAFPGRPDDVFSQGCNQLIRTNAAQLIQGADDLIESMQWKTKEVQTPSVQTKIIGLYEDLTLRQQAIAKKIQAAEEGVHINLIVMEMGLNYNEVAADLVMMEILGLIKEMPGGIYRFVR